MVRVSRSCLWCDHRSTHAKKVVIHKGSLQHTIHDKVGNIAYDEPNEARILADEQKLIHLNLKDLPEEGYYKGNIGLRRKVE